MHVSTGNVEAALNFSPAEFKQSAPRAREGPGPADGRKFPGEKRRDIGRALGVTWPVEKA